MLIKKVSITEKSNSLADKLIYAFHVDRKATKPEIRKYIEKYFNVKVKSVRTLICRGRSRRTSRGQGKVPYWKKAFIRLREGEKITMFEGGS